ncbi:hypothetical protein SAMN05428949_5635 [Chitinophaga sp. YR627]|nr:hypothetical protein SAMN05428949_5635 [Chitinophaga sp. YR627]
MKRGPPDVRKALFSYKYTIKVSMDRNAGKRLKTPPLLTDLLMTDSYCKLSAVSYLIFILLSACSFFFRLYLDYTYASLVLPEKRRFNER